MDNWTKNLANSLIEKVELNIDYRCYRCKKCNRRVYTDLENWKCGEINFDTGVPCNSTDFYLSYEPIHGTFTGEQLDFWNAFSNEKQQKFEKMISSD